MSAAFEQIGWFKEYYVAGKFVGSIRCEKDREVIGYDGRKTETTSEALVMDNKKKIKPGTEVVTQLFPLNGKLIKA